MEDHQPGTNHRRRHFLRQAAGLGVLASTASPLLGAAPSGLSPIPRLDKPFEYHWDQLISRARTLASAPFQPESNATVITQWIDSLHAVHPQGIRMIPQAFLGKQNQAPFQIEGLYPDNHQRKSVAVYLVEDGRARQWIFRGNQFRYGDAAVATNAPQNLFYGGIAVWLPGDDSPFLRFDGVGQYQAASIPGQFDILAQVVEVNPALSRPGRQHGGSALRTRAIFLNVPKDRWSPLEVDLLIDSPKLSGAIHMQWTRDPDGQLHVRQQQVWFARDPLIQLGLAPQSLTVPTAQGLGCRPEGLRALPSASWGVRLLDDRNQGLWRPVASGSQTTLTVFETEQPKGGFGLQYRPNPEYPESEPFAPANMHTQCWTVPGPGWPGGNLELIESRSAESKSVRSSTVAKQRSASLCWAVNTPVDARQQQRPVALTFEQHWALNHNQRALTDKLHVVTSELDCTGSQRAFRVQVVIDFTGGIYCRDLGAFDLASKIHTSRGTVGGESLQLLPSQAPDGEAIAQLRFYVEASGPEPLALRAQILQGKETASEIWLFTYLPGI